MHLVSWDNAVNRDRAELIFTNRNHEYGAYVIRRDYEKIIVYALLYTLAGIVLIISIPVIISWMSGSNSIGTRIVEGDMTFTQPLLPDRPIVIPKTTVPPPPVAKTIRFTPLHVVRVIAQQDPPPTIEQIKDNQIGTKDIEGKKDIAEVLPANPVIDEDIPVLFVPEMPQFPGGESALLEYLVSHITYPGPAREAGIQGVVYISFVVDREGRVRDAKIAKGIGSGCDEEALRVIKSLPQWRPGRQNGKPVSVIYNVPVRFKLR